PTYVYGNGRATYTNESTGDSYHYLTSQSGSVTGLTQNGNSVASSSYNLYGATKQTTDTTGNPFAYNGEARDVTGLDYLRARYYDSQAGIFLTADTYPGSQTDPLSQNLYAYVQNNPANYTDPSGHIWKTLTNAYNTAKKAVSKVYNAAKKVVVDTYNTVKKVVVNTYNTIKSAVGHAVNWVGQKVNQAVNWAGNAVRQTTNWIGQQFTSQRGYNNSTRNYVTYQQSEAQRQAIAQQQYQQRVNQEYITATGIKGQPKTREAQNLFKNWGAALREMYTHVCNPQTTKGKDSGSRNKPNISVADFRKIEEANKYGLTVAEKAKIDKMSMSDLKSQYSSVIGNYNTYIGTGYFNPLAIGENRAVIERYKVLKAEEEAKAAAQAAELAKYHYLNLYKHIQETGLRPDGTPATDLEKKIAPYVPWIPIVQAGVSAYAGYQYSQNSSNLPTENGAKWRLGSGKKTDAISEYLNKNIINFSSEEALELHFNKHGDEFGGVYNTPNEYLSGANAVIENGIKVQYTYRGQQTIGYVRFMGNNSKGYAKFEFVGLNSNGNIATYHVKSGNDFWRALNGSNGIKNITPVE
uniref:RHS repeat-associated core domain-containing protein n=1 Tax=Streptococcus suis TaxID=1307 RepID=UPI001EE71ACF